MHHPLLQSAELTGEMRPLESLQSQNQLPQSSAVLHATFVAPLGLLGPLGVGPELSSSGADSVASDSSVGDDDDGRFELLPPEDDEEDDVPVSGPPEQATTKATRPAEKRYEKAFMAAASATARPPANARDFRRSSRAVAQRAPRHGARLAPGWRYHMLIGSGMNRSTNMTSVKIAIALRRPSSGASPVGG